MENRKTKYIIVLAFDAILSIILFIGFLAVGDGTVTDFFVALIIAIIFMTIIGLILTVPLLIYDKIQSKKEKKTNFQNSNSINPDQNMYIGRVDAPRLDNAQPATNESVQNYQSAQPVQPIIQNNESEINPVDAKTDELLNKIEIPSKQTAPGFSGEFWYDRLGLTKKNLQKIMRHYVVLDFETTGFSPETDKIIRIAILEFRAGEMINQFHTYINPHIPIPGMATAVNGITDTDVINAPDISDVLPEIEKMIRGVPVVGHNVTFDLKFLKKAYEHTDGNLNVEYFDTLSFSRSIFRKDIDVPNHKLETLTKYLGIEHKPHDPISDAKATSELFCKCFNRYYWGVKN